jgi:putative membrane protein
MIDWRHWHNEPYLVGGLVILAWLYALAVGPLRPWLAPDQAFPRRPAVCFGAALLMFYLAVGSPLDQIGERFLFSAHMVQHALLIYPAAVLFLAGLPVWLVDGLLARLRLESLARGLTHPIFAGGFYAATITLWHVPALYDWALQDKFIHILEHLMFFVAALAYWWPLLGPSRLAPPIRHGAQMIYLVLVQVAMTPLFAYLAFSPEVLYPTYEYAPRIIANFSPAEDQLLAAVIMKLSGLFVTFLALAWVFYRWYQATERRPA